MTRKSGPIGDHPKKTVAEAQQAMATCMKDLEQVARRFGRIAQELDVDLDDEDFPYEKPGPDHLRFFTALSSMGIHFELFQLLEAVRKAALRKHSDLVREWKKEQAREKAHPQPRPVRRTGPAARNLADGWLPRSA